jgi:hypothetical protein
VHEGCTLQSEFCRCTVRPSNHPSNFFQRLQDKRALLPDAQIVAGISAPPSLGQPDSFVIVTHENSVDLLDFCALSGVDSSRIISQIIFLAAAGNMGGLTEHSLLVSGHFDQERIYKSATDGGASVTLYRGIRVLTILPLRASAVTSLTCAGWWFSTRTSCCLEPSPACNGNSTVI